MLSGVGTYQCYSAPALRPMPLALAMMVPGWAKACRAANPGAYIILRSDPGADASQFDDGGYPVAEANLFATRFIEPALAQVPAGTYSAVLGPNENWPRDKEQWRAAFEMVLCRIVQDELGLDYIALSCPVGNLDDVTPFVPVFRQAAWVSYHGYLGPGRSSLAQETDPWYLWRPTRIWLPQLRKLGIPLRIIYTEIGTGPVPASVGLDKGALARLDLDIIKGLADECQRVGATFGGALPFGFGCCGKMGEDWNLDGNELMFASAEPWPYTATRGGAVADYPGAESKASPNFGYPQGTAGRAGHLVVAIVDHITAGSAAAADAVFMSPTAQRSAQYLITKTGKVVCYVTESNAAWTQGIDFGAGYAAYKSDLTIPWIADCWRDKVSPNLVAIGIEHEAVPGEVLTPAQLQASVALHKYLCAKYQFSATERGRIIGHNSLDAVNRPFDPGPGILAQIAAGIAGQSVPAVNGTLDLPAVRSHLDVLWGEKELLASMAETLDSAKLRAVATVLEERIVALKVLAGLQ